MRGQVLQEQTSGGPTSIKTVNWLAGYLSLLSYWVDLVDCVTYST